MAHPKFSHQNVLDPDMLVDKQYVWFWDGVHDCVGASWPLPYAPGDRLWVRETWAEVSSGIIEYKASYQEPYTGLSDIDHVGKKIKWKSPRFMPKVAARIWLEVTNVRVERLQEISDVDRLKEGIRVMAATAEELLNDYKTTEMGRREFRELWDSLNAKRGYGWDVNPWVWVIEFKRVDHD